MLEVILLAIALSMDAFAVSIGLGAKTPALNIRLLALKTGIYFGLFQGLMPLIGYIGGHSSLGFIGEYANWLAFSLLLFIGLKMLFEALSEGVEEDISQVTHRVLLTLAIATSIDALAAGFSLTLLAINPWLACAIIALTTFGFGVIGTYIGHRSGCWLESRAETFGALILIALAFKFLFI